jgi:hypothetical protein
MREKATCTNGHRWTPESTYVRPSNGAKLCKICKRESVKRRRSRERMKNAKLMNVKYAIKTSLF